MGLVCIIESVKFLGSIAQVNIIVISILDAAMLLKKVVTGKPEFDKHFIVWSKDDGIPSMWSVNPHSG